MHSSLKVNHSVLVRLRSTLWLLQHLHSLIFSHSVVEFLLCLDHYPILWPNYDRRFRLFDRGRLNNCKVLRSYGCKPNARPTLNDYLWHFGMRRFCCLLVFNKQVAVATRLHFGLVCSSRHCFCGLFRCNFAHMSCTSKQALLVQSFFLIALSWTFNMVADACSTWVLLSAAWPDLGLN